ncbi:DEAD/DEAH box helicase [Metabacillus sp. HB246100]
MKSTKQYIKLWQKALRAEIMHLKKYGSTKYSLYNGEVIHQKETNTYYFETPFPIKVPIGSTVKIENGKLEYSGKLLSSEGKSVILSVEKPLGRLAHELLLSHDPWELLDQLHERLEEASESKQKRLRIKRLMNPPSTSNHPTEQIKSNVHELVVRSKYNPVTFVWGPPGTGKTYTLARVAANKYFKKQSVLLLSQSNQAVDVLMSEISRFVDKKGRFREGDLLRYGSQSHVISRSSLTTTELLEKRHPDIAKQKQQLLDERIGLKQDLGQSFSQRDSQQLLSIEGKLAAVLEKIRQKEIEFIEDAVVIGTTLAKAANDPSIYDKTYDVVIVDEASMAYVPQIAFAATLGKRIVICGDFKQLPPIASAKSPLVEEWLKEDIFHKSGVVEWLSQEDQLHPNLFLLKEQRRMHPDISSFTNKVMYQSLVGDHESVLTARNQIVERAPFPNYASLLVDSSKTGNHCLREKNANSRFNVWQLLLSFQLIHESYLSGARSIGYTTPYRAQATLMTSLLQEIYEKECLEADIVAATVHRFQGSERDVMLFDNVDSYPETRPGMLLVGKESDRVLNVAITRTKGKFIHICNKQFIQEKVFPSKTIRKLVDHQISSNQLVEPHQIGKWVRNQHNSLRWVHAKKVEAVFEDIKNAKQSVIAGLPPGKHYSKEWQSGFTTLPNNVKFTMLSESEAFKGKKVNWIDKSLSFPFIIIDEKILWLGMPFEAGINVQPPFVGARLVSEAVVSYFLKQIM